MRMARCSLVFDIQSLHQTEADFHYQMNVGIDLRRILYDVENAITFISQDVQTLLN